MAQTYETPAGKAGARGDLLGGWSQEASNPTAPLAQFPDHRQAALALLNGDHRLTRKAGQFLGQLSVDSSPMSEAQTDWLAKLLDKRGLPSLARPDGQ